MEPARVSSPQVDMTRCGLHKTLTLLVLQCPGATRSAEGKEVHSWDAGPRWQSLGEARPRAEVGDHIPPSTGKRGGSTFPKSKGHWGSPMVSGGPGGWVKIPPKFWCDCGSRQELACPEVPVFEKRQLRVPAAAGGCRSRPGRRCRGARALRPACPPVRCWYRPCGPPAGV